MAALRRPKSGLADDRQGSRLKSCWQLMITPLASLARYQAGGALTAIPIGQPLDLTPAQSEPLGSAPWFEHAVGDRLNHLEPVQLAHRHCYPFCRSHLGLQHREHGGPDSLRCSKADISK
jgi:hypothetical protein